MKPGDTTPRIAVIWSTDARTGLRAIDREPAMQILYCLDRYLSSRAGDVKKLKPPRTGSAFAAATTACSSIAREKRD